jgi:hypothetical protein
MGEPLVQLRSVAYAVGTADVRTTERGGRQKSDREQ